MITPTPLIILATAALLVSPTSSFLCASNPIVSIASHEASSARFMFFADDVKTEPTSLLVTPLDGSDDSIQRAASFMIDSFWLQSPHHLSDSAISDDAKTSLVRVQANDLMNKYGERLGKRKLDAVILQAVDDTTSDMMLGLVTVEVRLLDSISKAILNADRSELMLTNAISSLGPKQRREYKDASVMDVAHSLLPPEITAVCSLSNLCVSPDARRRGVAGRLCYEAELLAKELGFDEMHLCVESENAAAKALYIKLGYGIKFETKAKSLRVVGDAGKFNEVDAEIVIMAKKI